MPKVTGPLFSLAASGTFRGELEFRNVNGKSIVAGARTAPSKRSAAQLAQSSRFRLAATAWKTLSAAQQAAWKTAAAPAKLSGYQLYLSEYQGQNISPPDQPVIP